MANAIKHISVERGYDVTEYALCCFGGAGGQHACLVADALGMTRVLLHPLAGVLSAYGMGVADVRALRQQAVEARLASDALARIAALLRIARRRPHAPKWPRRASPDRDWLRRARCTSSTKAPTRRSRCPWRRSRTSTREFARRYRQQYGFLMPDKPLVIEAVAVEVAGRAHDAAETPTVVSAAGERARADPNEPDLHGVAHSTTRRSSIAPTCAPVTRLSARR